MCTIGMVSDASAAGFQILEQSARLTGTAYAGTAAWGEDASTGFFNPAALTRIEHGSIVGTLSVADIDVDLTASSASTFGQPITGAGSSMKADGGVVDVIPAFHLAYRVSDRVVASFGVTSPFGADTDYPDDSVTRYIGTRSKVETFALNPGVGFGPWKGLSIGVGLNALYLRADIDQKFAVPLGPIDPALDVVALVHGEDWAFGWNAGLLYEFDEILRFGFSYRSATDYTLAGPAQLLTILGPVDGTFNAGFSLPNLLTWSGVWQPQPWLELLVDVQYADWSRFQVLDARFAFDTSGLPPGLAALVPARDTVYERFRDTWRTAIGAQFHPDDAWTIRLGTGFDQSPVDDSNRTVRIPDGNRYLVTFGLGYEVFDGLFVDFGYAHYFLREGTIDETNTTIDMSRIQARFDNAADVFAFQLTYDWKKLPFL